MSTSVAKVSCRGYPCYDHYLAANWSILLLDFSLQLDTGSSDLWLHSPTPVNTTNTTDTLITLTYGLGSAAGKVDYASLAIGDYTIPEQGGHVSANLRFSALMRGTHSLCERE